MRDADEPYDLRLARAQSMTAHVMNIVGKYICRHTDEGLHSKASRELLDAFHTAGVEVLTDADRLKAGLPARGVRGWTAGELQILEVKRRQLMLEPFPPLSLDEEVNRLQSLNQPMSDPSPYLRSTP